MRYPQTPLEWKSKKKLRAINYMSVFVEELRRLDGKPEGEHWTDFPPETWSDYESELWDLSSAIEEKLKQQIIKIL